MLIQWRGHAFQHDQAALIMDPETSKYDLHVQGVAVIGNITEQNAETLISQIREAEKQTSKAQQNILARGFLGYRT